MLETARVDQAPKVRIFHQVELGRNDPRNFSFEYRVYTIAALLLLNSEQFWSTQTKMRGRGVLTSFNKYPNVSFNLMSFMNG